MFRREAEPGFTNIGFRQIRGSRCSPIRVIGYREGDILDITFDDMMFGRLEGGNPDSEAASFGEAAKTSSPDAPVYPE